MSWLAAIPMVLPPSIPAVVPPTPIVVPPAIVRPAAPVVKVKDPAPAGQHMHVCGACGYRWTHSDAARGDVNEHLCPRCHSGPWWTPYQIPKPVQPYCPH